MNVDAPRPSRPSPETVARVRRHAAALGAVAVIAVLRLLASPVLGDRALFLPFVLAVVLAASLGGRGPALTATGASAIAAVLLAAGGRDPASELLRDSAAVVVFIGVAAVVALLAVQLTADRERARTSARRFEQLQSVSNAVARGLPVEEVARAVLREGLESLGAGAGVVGVVNDDGETIRVVASSGYGAGRIAPYATFRIDEPLPMSEAVRLRQPIVMASTEELRARYPTLADAIRRGGSSVVLPLLYEERAIGALYFRFDGDRSFDADDRAYFLTLGRQCASAMVRARLAEAERAATDRLSFLVRAGEVLNASLDVDETLVRLSHLTVPELADWCGVHILEPDGAIRLVEVAHADPRRAAVARGANPGRPTLDDERGIGAVIRTGEVEHVEALDADLAARALRDPVWGPIAAGIPPRAYAILPLVARGRIVGSLTLLTDESGRTIGDAELQLGEQLAARAAMALDNARLYRELATREARRSAIARLGQQAIGLAAPAALPAAAAREVLDALPGVESAAVLELAGDELRVVASATRSDRTSPEAVLAETTDPALRSALAAGTPFVGTNRDGARRARRRARPATHERAGRGDTIDPAAGQIQRIRLAGGRDTLFVPIPTSVGPWGAVAAVLGADDDPESDAVAFVGEVASVLGDALERARRLEEERRAQEIGRAFIGVVSHELRTPITSIYAGAKLLRRVAGNESERTEIAADVEAEADRLYRLTEDLLVLTRLERNDLEIGREPVLVSRLLERVVASERQHWPLIDFRLRIAPSIRTAVGEDNYVEQVLRNLVGNAAKYSPAGSTIEVEAAPTDDGGVSVRVLDRGPGVSAADRDRLFSLFYRSPATASQASGAGIGLFVCEQLVRAMGGRLWAKPRPDGGSEFGFALLPYLDVDDEEAEPSTEAVRISS